MNNTEVLKSISRYIYGTTRLGDEQIPFKERVNVAYAAMNAGVWFHTSRQYNNSLELLSVAFDKDRTKVPKLIAKIAGNSIEDLKADIRRNLDPIGLKSLDVGQLCLGGDLANDFAAGGNSLKELETIRESGLVKSYVLEVFPWTSQIAKEALQGGYTNGIIDAFILCPFFRSRVITFFTNGRTPIRAPSVTREVFADLFNFTFWTNFHFMISHPSGALYYVSIQDPVNTYYNKIAI